MKMNGTKRERVEVEINELEVIQTLWDQWKRKVRKGDWIEDGFWYKEYITSHRWDSKECEASQEEIQIYDAFRTVYDVVKQTA